MASEGGHKRIVSSLLKHGANVDVKDFTGKTPLMLALTNIFDDKNECSCEAVVKSLIQFGADVRAEDERGKTTLYYACKITYSASTCDNYFKILQGDKEIFKQLLLHGANPNKTFVSEF